MTNSKQISNIKYQISKDKKQNIFIKKSGNYLIELIGEGAQVLVNGRFLAEKNNKLDIEIIIHHQAPNTKAAVILKAVGKDKSQIKLAGKIIVNKNCHGTNSFLTERVLLLSDEAKAEAIPDLEIESDDVKCSHAVSVSNLSEEQMFYLMSRGLSRKKAEEMIVDGFLDTIDPC